jgi:predicted transposase/invertase (TIGR01784 family)
MGIIETIKMITLEEGIEKGIEQGIEKGRHKEQITFVTNLLLNTNFDITKIASLSGVSEDFVKNVKQSLTK